jgi:hypothetical protein
VDGKVKAHRNADNHFTPIRDDAHLPATGPIQPNQEQRGSQLNCATASSPPTIRRLSPPPYRPADRQPAMPAPLAPPDSTKHISSQIIPCDDKFPLSALFQSRSSGFLVPKNTRHFLTFYFQTHSDLSIFAPNEFCFSLTNWRSNVADFFLYRKHNLTGPRGIRARSC